ncbi:hypothetical protein AK830_g12104 [Neonectria ditissima]|uniref:Zn(2)-C6 fungal-type domain-containing protein n=1 Tax=Neonectria ditissima TaxID=78410 RepID=A0A0P7B667_9HYPO|nr:hypothetical protein AK830_g12104 [Neonectria ditissima]
MFTIFGVNTPSSSSSEKTPPPPQPRPKRAQVSRACDWCRLTRVKCDSVRPCRNCKEAKRECVNAGRDDFKSVAAATKEVQRLRSQVQELEASLMASPSRGEDGCRKRARSVNWRGTMTNEVLYGPSSLHYFSHRLATFAKLDIIAQSHPKALRSPPWDAIIHSGQLQRQQQDVLFDLFWQGYHAVYPILDEASFRAHYSSLWDSPTRRKPCPLVDSVLALCIQFGATYMSHGSADDGTSTPGRDFYLRAQTFLSQNSESQSLMTAQCYFLNAVYLLATDQANSAYTLAGTAIRVAQSLGLQYEPVPDESAVDLGLSESRRRLWNCLSMLDVKLSLHLGRPFAIQSFSPEEEESASDQLAETLGPTFTLSSELGINWLTFQHERRRLFNLVREIHEGFYTVCEDILGEIQAPDFYQHPPSREKCAQFLFVQMKKLKKWVHELPDGLKTPRQNGIPLSIDRSALDLSHSEPLWLQRQRLILELEYHTFSIILRRPFISFLPTPALGTLSSDNHCIVAGNSAIIVTNLLHQVLKDTDILTGWYQVVDWQHNAVFALAGFTCGYPICPLSPSLRRTLPTAAVVFDMAGATDKVELAHKLRDRSFQILKEFGAKIGITNLTTMPHGRHSTNTTAHTPVDADLGTMEIGDKAFPGASALSGIDAENLWPEGFSESLLWGDLMQDLGTGMMPPIDEGPDT